LLTYGSQEFEATVSKLLPTADEAQRFEVWLEVKVDDPQMLKPGSTGEVTITVDTHPNQPVIQRRALIGNDSVFVVENGVVRRRPVKVGYMALNVVEIREGLKDGEQVIVDMLDEFREGQRVKVQVVN
jgi:multidrug efflux pump subunit AcrA (membrane-fusion protein)